MTLAGAFALFHGLTHGAELAGAGALAGMMLGAMILHVLRIGIGTIMKSRMALWSQALGSVVALVGVGLLIGAI